MWEKLLCPAGLVPSLWSQDQSGRAGGECSAAISPPVLTAWTYKARTKTVDLYYQAVETAKMVIMARGEEGCLPGYREQSRTTYLTIKRFL